MIQIKGIFVCAFLRAYMCAKVCFIVVCVKFQCINILWFDVVCICFIISVLG